MASSNQVTQRNFTFTLISSSICLASLLVSCFSDDQWKKKTALVVMIVSFYSLLFSVLYGLFNLFLKKEDKISSEGLMIGILFTTPMSNPDTEHEISITAFEVNPSTLITTNAETSGYQNLYPKIPKD